MKFLFIKTFFTLLLGILLIFPSLGFCKHLVLFDKNETDVHERNKNYSEKIKLIQIGDTVEFSNGKTFFIKNILGRENEGLMSHIFDVGDERIIRIDSVNGIKYHAVNMTLDGYDEIKKAGIRLVDIYPDESLRGEYVLQDKAQIRRNLSDIISFWERIPYAEQIQIKDSLRDFIVSTYKFQKVSDLRPPNIIWDGKDIKMLDWTHWHERYSHEKSDPTRYGLSDHKFELSRIFTFDDFQKIEQEIRQLRKLFIPLAHQQKRMQSLDCLLKGLLD